MSEEIRKFFERMSGEVRPDRSASSRMLQRASRRRVRSVAILGVVAAVVGYGGFAGVQALTRPSPSVPTGLGQCSWESVPSPNRDPDRLVNQLDGVFALSDDDVWAVGSSYVDQEGGENFPLTMHWDGSSWAVVPVPDSYGHQDVRAVDGSSSDDVWGIGLGHEALHWDGETWSTVPLADPGTTYWHLEDVSALRPDDVWAVGNTAGGHEGGNLVEHWDGSTWSVVQAPSPPPETLTADAYPSLSAVDALSSTDAWATGQTENVAPVGESNTVALHWDGTAWAQTPTPDVAAQNGDFGHLLDVAAVAPDDVWAVGIAANQPGIFGGGDRALIEHWDGNRWTVSDTLSADSRLVGVAAVSGDGVWAVGSTGYSGSFQPLVLHWDGAEWTPVSTGITGEAWLSDISATPSGDLWAVGYEDQTTLTLHCSRG